MSRKLHDEELISEGGPAVQNPEAAAEPESAGEAALPAAEPAAQIFEEEVERLRAERDAALADREALQDRLARLQAEFENARKREARERSEIRDYSVASAVEAFLPVLDNFQLALAATGSAEQLRAGVELIVKQMEEALRSLSITPIETVGTQFDPRVHEALEMVEREDVPDHQVIEEVRRGYRIKERLMRPALVRVASNSKQTQA